LPILPTFWFCFFFFFAIMGFELRVLALARQDLYHLNHASSLFCSGFFGARVSFFTQAY
jgi:hypothetical protein